MRPIVFLFLVSLLHSYDVQGSAALTRHFVLTGTDLLLEVTAPVHRVPRSELKWKYNRTENIVRLFSDNYTEIHESYQGRVKFFLQNYSLLLRNVTQTDSGRYSAAVVSQRDESVGEHSVTVQDFVSPVHGTVASVSFSPDSCNLTVTCSTQDSYCINATFRCSGNTCSQDRGSGRREVTTSGAYLGVYLHNNYTVVCNHTNQISSANDTIMIKQHCLPRPEPPPSLIPIVVLIITITIAVALVTAVITAHFVLKKQRKSEGSVDLKNTVYETVQVKTVPRHLDLTPSDEAPAPSEATTYCLVEPGTMTLPESMYAQVNRMAKSEENQ